MVLSPGTVQSSLQQKGSHEVSLREAAREPVLMWLGHHSDNKPEAKEPSFFMAKETGSVLGLAPA